MDIQSHLSVLSEPFVPQSLETGVTPSCGPTREIRSPVGASYPLAALLEVQTKPEVCIHPNLETENSMRE